jgi:hypothetical protein
MRTVRVVSGESTAEDATDSLTPGERYVLLKASGAAWLVRDPTTGERRYLPADRLERVDEPPLAAAADGVAPSLRRLLTAVRDERTLGLLVTVVDRWRTAADSPEDADADAGRSATSVRWLLDATSLCESDLHGALAELEAADLLARTATDAPGGGRAYRPTERALDAVERLRGT